MVVQRGDDAIDAAREEIIDEESHPHPALGGVEDAAEKELATEIPAPEIGLNINRDPGGVDQGQAPVEIVLVSVQKQEA